jgi:hypothetical protein
MARSEAIQSCCSLSELSCDECKRKDAEFTTKRCGLERAQAKLLCLEIQELELALSETKKHRKHALLAVRAEIAMPTDAWKSTFSEASEMIERSHGNMEPSHQSGTGID